MSSNLTVSAKSLFQRLQSSPNSAVHGGHDVLGVEAVKQVYDYALRHGIKAPLRLTSEEETEPSTASTTTRHSARS